MKINDKTAIITGAASGIGKALAKRFVEAGARVMIADRSLEVLQKTADEIGATPFLCDVTNETEIQNLVAEAENTLGPIDIFCSNAGMAGGEPSHSASASNELWQTSFDVHVMAQVYAARAVLPAMIERGDGYIINMASAAGLLSQIGDAAYSATKHASVGFSESLAITHGDDGIKVSVICPQYVATSLTGYKEGGKTELNHGTITVEAAVDAIMAGIHEDRFMILTHPEVENFFQKKASDYNRWISGMRKMRRNIIEAVGSTHLKDMHKLF